MAVYVPKDLRVPSRDSTQEDDNKYFGFYEHVRLLIEANLIEGVSGSVYLSESHPRVTYETFHPYRLTWAGHEFLGSIRDAGTWSKIKSVSIEKGASLTFDVIRELGISLLKGTVGLS